MDKDTSDLVETLKGCRPAEAVSAMRKAATKIKSLTAQLADQKTLVKGLSDKCRKQVAMLDDLHGTPCEQIRHEQEITRLREELAGEFSILRNTNKTRCVEWMDSLPELENIDFHALELGGECGEAQNICKKIARHRRGIPGALSPEEARPMLAEELADIIICCDMVAAILNIDLWDEVCRKFNKTSAKHGFVTMLPPPNNGEG